MTADGGPDEVIVSLVENSGHRILANASLDEAIRELKEPDDEDTERHLEPAILLIDWARPNEDRKKIHEWLASLMKTGIVEIVIQCSEQARDDLDSEATKGCYFLSKPSDESQVSTILRAALNGHHLRRTLAERSELARNTFRLMQAGEFHFRTCAEAELLALQIGNAFAEPDSTVGILELMINAVEHGNLEISYEEKGQLLQAGTLEEEMNRRMELPEFSNRRVRVQFQRRDHAMRIEIEDDGPGFEFAPYLKLDRTRLFESHGRGILMANASLDIEYVPPGNRVVVKLPMT